MLKMIDELLSVQPPFRVMIFSFSIFYLIPVAIGSWYIDDRRTHILICIASAVTWLYVDVTSGHTYSHLFIPVWNTGVRLGFYIIVAYLLLRLRKSLALQASLAELDGLTGIMNARTFGQRCQSCFELASRHRQGLALAEVNQWPVGFSVDVAVYTSPPKSPGDAIRFADNLMYQVKNSGKNRILFEEFRH